MVCRCVDFKLQVCAINIVLVIQTLMAVIEALTGHVCRRQTQETYLVQSSRAFLCNERYTTSCGHLDWRRCTRYRVQTCYTPTQRYATRYREVEECCPGWQQSAGSCSIPVCHGQCQNGGVCSQTSAVPHCSCLPGYYGDLCQHKRESSPSTVASTSSSSSSLSLSPELIIIIIFVLVVLALITIALFVLRKRWCSSTNSSTTSASSPSTSPPSTTSAESTSTSGVTTSTSQTPLATISGTKMTTRIVQPSAPSFTDH